METENLDGDLADTEGIDDASAPNRSRVLVVFEEAEPEEGLKEPEACTDVVMQDFAAWKTFLGAAFETSVMKPITLPRDTDRAEWFSPSTRLFLARSAAEVPFHYQFKYTCGGRLSDEGTTEEGRESLRLKEGSADLTHFIWWPIAKRYYRTLHAPFGTRTATTVHKLQGTSLNSLNVHTLRTSVVRSYVAPSAI